MWYKNNKLYVVNDINLIRDKINRSDTHIIIIGNQQTNDYNVFNAGILAPPIEIMMKWADNRPSEAMQCDYPRYLSCPEPDQMIVAILGLLSTGDVFIVMTDEEFVTYGNVLLNNIYYNYGVIAESYNTRFAFNKTRLPFLLSKFFIYGLMPAQDYLDSYPVNQPLPDWVINKLATDLHVVLQPNTFADYYNYFTTYLANRVVPTQMVQSVEGKNDNIH